MVTYKYLIREIGAVMKKILLIIMLISPVFGMSVTAEELTDEKKQVIDELLMVTGAEKMAVMMGQATFLQFSNFIRKHNPKATTKTYQIIEAEVLKVIEDEFLIKGGLRNISYPIYHKHLTLHELKELLAFYRTPVGKKIISVLPAITQEGMLAGQTLGRSMAPRIVEQVKKRLQEEGIKLNNI
jgi:uncharacterized protein